MTRIKVLKPFNRPGSRELFDVGDIIESETMPQSIYQAVIDGYAADVTDVVPDPVIAPIDEDKKKGGK